MTQEIDGCTCSQIRAADTKNEQNIRITLDLGCCLLNSRKLLLVVVDRKIYPSKKIVSGTRSGNQKFLRRKYLTLNILNFFFLYKTLCLGIIKCNLCHWTIPPCTRLTPIFLLCHAQSSSHESVRMTGPFRNTDKTIYRS